MKIYIRDVLMNLLFRGDEVSYIRMVKARQYLLDALPKAYESGWRNNQCVFVLSTGRTGTMQLTALLNLSPQILAFHEPTPVLLKAGADAYQEGCETGKWSHFLHGGVDIELLVPVIDQFVHFEMGQSFHPISPYITL